MATLVRHAIEYQICYACETAFRLFRHPGTPQWSVSVIDAAFGSEDITYFDEDYLEAHAYWRKVKSCPCLKPVPV